MTLNHDGQCSTSFCSSSSRMTVTLTQGSQSDGCRSAASARRTSPLMEGASMPSYESSMRNLERAGQKFRPPRPWCSSQESEMIRRFAFQWFTCCDASRPSGRDWARQLGISHTCLQKLVGQFQADPSEMRRLQDVRGDPRFADLARAREYTQQMRERYELRGPSPKRDMVSRLARYSN